MLKISPVPEPLEAVQKQRLRFVARLGGVCEKPWDDKHTLMRRKGRVDPTCKPTRPERSENQRNRVEMRGKGRS
jgi:hypothetical protein